MSSFPISITWNVSSPPVGGFNQLAQASSNLDAALQTSAQNMDKFSQSIDQLDKPLSSAGQGFGDLSDNMDGLDKSLDSSAGAMEDLGDATDDMSDAVEGVGDSVGDAADGFEELADGADTSGSALEEMSGTVEETGTGLENMGTSLQETGTGLEDMGTSVETANTGLADMTTAVEETATGLADMTTGVEDTTTGVEDLGTGIEDTGTGFEDFGSSVSDATTGLEGFDEGIGDTGANVSVLSGSFDDASESTEGFSGALAHVDPKLHGVNGGLTTGNTLTTNLAGSTKVLGGNMTNLGIGMAGVSGAAIGLFNAYDNIGDAAVGVEVAQGALIRTQARAETSINNLDKAMEDLNKRYSTQIEGIGPLNEAYAQWKSLVDQNITSGAEYDKALQNLKAAQEAANGTTRDAEQALTAFGGKLGMTEAAIIRQVGAENQLANSQEMLNQTYLQSATSIIPSVILGLTGMRDMVRSVKDIVAATPGAFTALVGVLKGLPAMFTAIGSAISTSMLPALAAIAVPAGIAVLAIGAVVAAIMAIRASLPVIDQLGMAIGNAVPQSVGFLDALRAAFISTSDAVNSSISFMLGGLDQLTGGSMKLKEGFDKWVSTLPGATAETQKLGGGIKVLNTGMDGLNATLVMQKGTFIEYNGNLKDLDNNMIALAGDWHKNAQGAAVVTKAYGDNSSATEKTASIQSELNAALKPYSPLAFDAAAGTDANAKAADAASMSQAALKAAVEGDSSALIDYIVNATGGAVSSEELGAGADTAAAGMEGITPAAGDAGQATMTLDQALQQAAQSTDPLVAGLAQAQIELRNQAREADVAFVKNTQLLKVWGVDIPAAIATDVNAIQALVNVEKDEHSATDTTLIKAYESIIAYGDISKAVNMTRDQKLAYAKQLEENVKTQDKETESTEKAKNVIEDYTKSLEEATTTLTQYVGALKTGELQALAFSNGQLKAEQALVDVIIKIAETSGELSIYSDALELGIKKATEYASGQQAIYKSVLDNIFAIENLRGQIDALNASLEAAALVEFVKGLLEGALAATKLTTEIAKANGEWLGFRNALLKAHPELQKFGDLSRLSNERLKEMATVMMGSREAIHGLVESFMEGAAAFNDFVASVDFREIDDKVKEGVDKFRESLDDMVDIARDQGANISDEFVGALDFDNAIQTAAGVMEEFWPTIEAAVATGNPNFLAEGIDLFTANVKHALEDADLPGSAMTQVNGLLAEIDKLRTIKDPVELLLAMENIKSKITALKDGKANLETVTTALTTFTKVTPGNIDTVAQAIANMASAVDLLKLSPAQIDAWAQSLSQLSGVPVDQLKTALETKMQETGASATSKLMEAGPGGDAARAALAQQMVALVAVFEGFQTDVGNVFINLETIFDAFVGVAQTTAISISGAFNNTATNITASVLSIANTGKNLILAFIAIQSGSQIMATTVSGSFSNMSRNVALSLATLKSNVTTSQTTFTTFQRSSQTMATTVSGSFSNMQRNAASSLSNLKSGVSSTMSSISSSMKTAESRARALASAINALKSKSITITTTYVTVRRTIYAAKGGAFIASSPTNVGPLNVSEFSQKELVTVTPLEGPGRQPVKGLSDLIGKQTEKKGRRAMDEEREEPRGERGRRKEMVMVRETPIIIQIDGREISRVVNRRIFEESDALT